VLVVVWDHCFSVCPYTFISLILSLRGLREEDPTVGMDSFVVNTCVYSFSNTLSTTLTDGVSFTETPWSKRGSVRYPSSPINIHMWGQRRFTQCSGLVRPVVPVELRPLPFGQGSRKPVR